MKRKGIHLEMRRMTESEVKERLFTILSDYADYCDEHGLRYYLCGGTLLGAIRHKGFIPWDDDIDVIMPRPDYDRLVQLNIQGMDSRYKLIGYASGNSLWPFSKIIDLTTYTENEYRASEENLWIDIFPMDGLPEDLLESSKRLNKTAKLRKLYKYYGARIGRGRNISRTIIKIPAILFFKYIGLKQMTHYIDRMARLNNFNNCTYIGEISWSLGSCERMKKEEYLPMVDVDFCGKKVHAPACYDKYLKAIYGDYMIVPEAKDRVTHEFICYQLESDESKMEN